MKRLVGRSAVRLALYLGAAAALLAVPPQVLERTPTVCLVQRTLGVECPGCGMGRAFSQAAHGHLAAAWEHNRMVIVAFPLAAGLWIAGMLAAAKEVWGGIRPRLWQRQQEPT